MSKETIPKVIHYCWFGKNPKSELINMCIDSWKRELPDYEIIEWNEENFDVNIIEYTKQAYECKKYAFVSDYARLWVINTHGGIYMDTDVQVLKNIDAFLEDSTFMGFEGEHGVNLGLVFGSIKHNPIVMEIMEIYHKSVFIKNDNSNNITTIVKNTTDVLIKHGLILNSDMKQNIDGIIVYPKEFFCPELTVGDIEAYGENTHTVHHYEASWMTEKYKKQLGNSFWRAFFSLSAISGKVAKKILGQKRWEYIRNRYLLKIYNLVRGQ